MRRTNEIGASLRKEPRARYLWLFGSAFNLAPGKGHTGVTACVAEVLYTFMLCFTVLSAAVSKRNPVRATRRETNGKPNTKQREDFSRTPQPETIMRIEATLLT